MRVCMQSYAQRNTGLHVQPLRRPFTVYAAKGSKGSKDLSPGTPTNNAPSLTDNLSKKQDEVPLQMPAVASSAVAAVDTLSVSPLKIAYKRLLIELSSLPRAIAIMAVVAGASGLGTIIPQNKGLEYYMENYPADGPSKVLGFLSYDLIYALQLDHIYTAGWFYGAILLLAASLTACTSTRQVPALKVAQKWRFLTKPSSFLKLERSEALPGARVADVAAQLANKGYQVFVSGPSMYAFKGLAGKLGPVGVHVALLMILAGTSLSGFAGLKGNVICPEGSDFVIENYIRPNPLAIMPGAVKDIVHVNSFNIDYRPDGQVAQFYSNLSILDERGQELSRQQISVNQPFRYGGVTMYQTDWSLAAVTMKVLNPEVLPDNGLPKDPNTKFTLPMASLEGRPGIQGRLWATFVPLEGNNPDGRPPKGISILARDMETVTLYDSNGQFVGVRRPSSGKPIEVEGVQLVVSDVVGSTGLEIKSDPGVPWVYAGFGGLMITVLVSYISHSQVWALQDGGLVYVGGKSNRAKLLFSKELDEALDAVPEVPGLDGA